MWLQEEGEEYGGHVDKIEQYLLEFAKLAEDVTLRKQALDSVKNSTALVQENEVGLKLWNSQDSLNDTTL